MCWCLTPTLAEFQLQMWNWCKPAFEMMFRFSAVEDDDV
jgi:hypothetical protein